VPHRERDPAKDPIGSFDLGLGGKSCSIFGRRRGSRVRRLEPWIVFLRRYAFAVAGADADSRSMDQAAERLCQMSTDAQLSGSATSDGAAYSLVEGSAAHGLRSENSPAFA
jgi:hypothetical protein